jgi:hypothetical protein
MSVCRHVIYTGIIMTFIWVDDFTILILDTPLNLLKNLSYACYLRIF